MPDERVAPGVAEAEVPGDLGVDAVDALGDHVADPLVVLLVVR